jgi:hypothetical protein
VVIASASAGFSWNRLGEQNSLRKRRIKSEWLTYFRLGALPRFPIPAASTEPKEARAVPRERVAAAFTTIVQLCGVFAAKYMDWAKSRSRSFTSSSESLTRPTRANARQHAQPCDTRRA